MNLNTLKQLFEGRSTREKLAIGLLLAWTLAEFLSIFLGGFASLSPYWAVANASRIAVILLNLWFLKRFFMAKEHRRYAAFRKYTGYALVLVYVAANLPILDWQQNKLIDDSAAFWLWLPSAVQALLMAALWLVLRLKSSQVFWSYISAAEAADKKLLHQRLRSTRRGFLGHVVENADMFIQTIFLVILLQQFVFQLYVIPSESMVPTMLKYDRPFVVKTLDGPAIPMTMMRLPTLTPIERGQIVVFEGPAYEPPPLYIETIQQLVFFMTLSTVNLDKDAFGNDKVHFIVKRVIGMPGDKLMMVDDQLYVRTAAEAEFRPLEADSQYRHVDLWQYKERFGKRIEYYPFDAELRDMLSRWDERRKALDPLAASADLARQADRIEALLKAIPASRLDGLGVTSQQLKNSYDTAVLGAAALAEGGAGSLSPLQDTAIIRLWTPELLGSKGLVRSLISPLSAYAARLVEDPALRPALRAFLTSANPAAATIAQANAYDQACYKTNLLYKARVAEELVAALELIRAGKPFQDPAWNGALDRLMYEGYQFYIWLEFFSKRNFPEFPAGEGNFLPKDKYFLLGDNRYVSLDFRFDVKDQSRTLLLDAHDPQSLAISTSLAPRMLDRANILGHVAFRVFPFDRLGAIKP